MRDGDSVTTVIMMKLPVRTRRAHTTTMAGRSGSAKDQHQRTMRWVVRRPRRKGKRVRVQYVERGKIMRGANGKRIEVGPLAIDRTVARRYEWRDAQLQAKKQTRAGAQTTRTEKRGRRDEGETTRNEARRRRRDPG